MPREDARSDRRFEGLSCVIVGGGVGIGRACAHRMAAEGGAVSVADIDQLAAHRVLDELEQLSDGRGAAEHRALAIDVTEESSVAAAVADLERVDVLVVVAGGDTAHGPFEMTGDEVWRQMFELNLLGTVRCVRAALPLLKAGGGPGAIVLVGSINGLTAMGSEPYSGAKAGLTSLATNLAVELGQVGIRVNVVAPATVRTRVWDGQPGGADRLRSLYPLGRVGEVEDIAAAITFLASPDASWITGITLPVDGGLLAGRRVPGQEV